MANLSFVFAFETDQYNLPPEPLADIGDELTQYVELNLRKAVGKLNQEISEYQVCLENNTESSKKYHCNSPDKNRKKLADLRSEQAIAHELYRLLGTGIPPFTSSGTWMESHHFNGEPARFKTGLCNSIFFILPIDYIGIGSTVNIYGSEFGTDKIAHLFQQGYTYYERYNRALSEGLTPDKASKKVVEWGQKTERTFYGTLISGVYSNGDLFANYVGMKFYQGLTQEIKIRDLNRPAVLHLENGLWVFNDIKLKELLIKPFISDHFNEALNPSIFTKHFGLRSYVKKVVKEKSCRQWLRQYPNRFQTDWQKISQNLELWNGEDYGFTASENFISIANTCFANKSSDNSQLKLNLHILKRFPAKPNDSLE